MSFNKRIFLDNVLATLFIFSLMGLFGSVSQFGIFDAFDPVGDALADMELSDLVFSQLREDPMPDTNIVVVNFGNLPRSGIGEQINIISKYKPRVIGMDSFFGPDNPRQEDTLGNLILSEAIRNAGNVVMVTSLKQSDSLSTVMGGEDIYDSLEISAPFFMDNAIEGFANLETEAVHQEDFKACRAFPPHRNVAGVDKYAFSVQIAKAFDSVATKKFLARQNDWETINYRGNTVDFFGITGYPNYFYVLDWYQVLEEDFVPEMIKDKVVIFGYLGGDLLDTSWDDKFFTPLNKKYAGKANPDMFGVVIHANIVSMLLNEDFINDMGETWGIILGIIICFINVILFSKIYRRLPRWYDGITKLIQLVELAFLGFIMVFIFHLYSFKLNLTITMIAVALAGDSLEVYYGVIKNMFRKESLKQLFTFGR